MRRGLLALTTTALVVLACGESGTPRVVPSASPSPAALGSPDPRGWVILPGSPESPANARHDDIVFLDAANGWLVNTRGEVHRTRDGGETWQPLASLPGVFLRCLGFASESLGWAGNLNVTAGTPRPDAALYETTDGGRTWANVSARIAGDPVVGLCGMRVLGSTIVAVGRWNGPAVFVKSADRGRTWTSRSVAPLASGLVDVFFFNDQDGFAVGGLGLGTSEAEQRASRTVVLRTSDGGATWQTRYLSEGAGEWAWKITFVDDQVGYVTTEGPAGRGIVLKTVDGGESWTPLVVDPGASFQGVAFVDRNRGWAGSFPTLFATTDGGASWTPLFFGTRVNRIRVVGPDLVFASGDRVYRWTP
jgi:photosystem II stability/assembly factor-like uncharacterized protein